MIDPLTSLATTLALGLEEDMIPTM